MTVTLEGKSRLHDEPGGYVLAGVSRTAPWLATPPACLAEPARAGASSRSWRSASPPRRPWRLFAQYVTGKMTAQQAMDWAEKELKDIYAGRRVKKS